MKTILTAIVCAAALLAPTIALSQEDSSNADPREALTIDPVLLDAQDGEGTTLGVDFTFRGKKELRNFDAKSDPNSDDLSSAADVTLGSLSIAYDISGTAAADEDLNPKNFLNALVDVQYLRSAPRTGSVSGGAFVKYETDQAFDDQQSVYGLRITYVKLKLLQDLDYIGIDLNRGQVDPDGDKAREAALGTTPLTKYYRNEAEFLYHLPLKAIIPVLAKTVEALEFNYRYFHESNAPAAVKAAGIDSAFLRTFRLRLDKGFFVAYSNGKLPFDLQEDDFFELGISYKLQ